ncbi:MAG: hypothetical protein CMC79_04895 [Flavobacteriaceae bacterium]|nr:hypothetical protein [Flavobacteriaceae bacterium]
MKNKYFRKLAVIAFILFLTNTNAQSEDIKVDFDITSSSTSVHNTAIRHLTGMAKAYPNSKFELVMYSGAGKLATYENKELAMKVSKVAAMDNARVILCEGTMNRLGLKKDDLVTGVETVPDGILEIAIKQAKGWAYIKQGLNTPK